VAFAGFLFVTEVGDIFIMMAFLVLTIILKLSMRLYAKVRAGEVNEGLIARVCSELYTWSSSYSLIRCIGLYLFYFSWYFSKHSWLDLSLSMCGC
jgi:hypothetical protein